MAIYQCVVDCLCQKHETDSLGRYVELVNLRAKAGETYEEAYDLLEFNDNPEGTVFFTGGAGQPTKHRGSDIASIPKRMPPPKKAKKKPEPESDAPVDTGTAPRPKANAKR